MQLNKGAFSLNINTYFLMVKAVGWWDHLSGEIRGAEFFLSFQSRTGKYVKNRTEKCAVQLGGKWLEVSVRDSVGP